MPLIVDLVCVILIFVVFYFAIKKQAKDEGHTSVTAEILDEAQSGKSGFKDSKGNELSKQDASHQATVYFLMYPFIMIGVIFIGLDVYTRFTAGIEIRLIYVGCLVATFLIYKIGFRNSKKQPNLQSHSSEVPPVKTPTSLSTNVPLSRNQVLTWRAYPSLIAGSLALATDVISGFNFPAPVKGIYIVSIFYGLILYINKDKLQK